MFELRRIQASLRRIARSPITRGGASLVLYLLLAFWTTWPLAQNPTGRLPLGTERTRTVPLFNAWTIWWNADRMLHGWNGYWDAPIFHPLENTFAFSEPQPMTVLVAPVLWLTGSRGLAYNVYLWGALVLNGLMAERLLRLAGVGWAIALGGGAAMVMLPIVHWQLGVLQLVPVWGILASWAALLKISRLGSGLGSGLAGGTGDILARRAALWRGSELGVAVAVVLLTSVHHGLFLAILLLGAAGTLGMRLRHQATWLALVSAVAVTALLTAPVIVKLYQVTSAHQFVRPPETVSGLSAMAGDYTAPAGHSPVDLGDLAARPGWRLSPGLLKFALAVAGIVFGLRHRRWRWWTLFLLVTAVLAFLLSLGTNLRFGAWRPWTTLAEVVPGLAQVRNVFRFAYFFQMAVVLLAALGLHLLWRLSRRRRGGSAWRYGSVGLLALVGLAAVADPWPNAPMLGVVPEVTDQREWIALVRNQTPPGRAIVCLPMAAGQQVLDFEITTRWMLLGTYHQVAMVNGYSGFFPPSYFETRDSIRHQGLSEDVLLRLVDDGIEFLVVDRSRYATEIPRGADDDSVSLQLVLENAGGVDVYRIRQDRGGAAEDG